MPLVTFKNDWCKIYFLLEIDIAAKKQKTKKKKENCSPTCRANYRKCEN